MIATNGDDVPVILKTTKAVMRCIEMACKLTEGGPPGKVYLIVSKGKPRVEGGNDSIPSAVLESESDDWDRANWVARVAGGRRL